MLTPAGRGAIASLLLVGAVELLDRHRLFVAANGRPLARQDIGRICVGDWGDGEDRLPTEQSVACRTGEEVKISEEKLIELSRLICSIHRVLVILQCNL